MSKIFRVSLLSALISLNLLTRAVNISKVCSSNSDCESSEECSYQ